MSARAEGAPLSPIVESSVPRCQCQGEQPCACERYAHRLELTNHGSFQRVMEADRKLAIAEAALGELEPRMKIAEAIAAIRAAREILL